MLTLLLPALPGRLLRLPSSRGSIWWTDTHKRPSLYGGCFPILNSPVHFSLLA